MAVTEKRVTDETRRLLLDTIEGLHRFSTPPHAVGTPPLGVRYRTKNRLLLLDPTPETLTAAIEVAVDLMTVLVEAKRAVETEGGAA